jgi:diacylglycerol kinase family enzyme
MARKLRRATLIHNEKAGDRRHTRAYLVGLLEGAGYDVSYFAVKQGDLAEALGHPAEIIVSAGGDGTVARVVGQARSDGPAIAILPLGTANNIAASLGIEGPLEDIVSAWQQARMRPYYPIGASGPWGMRRLIEGVGFGAFEEAMHAIPRKFRQTGPRFRPQDRRRRTPGMFGNRYRGRDDWWPICRAGDYRDPADRSAAAACPGRRSVRPQPRDLFRRR